MPTFDGNIPWHVYALWNLGAFFFAFIPHSFLEWLAHRFVLHSKAIVRFAYEEHDQRHHKQYLEDHTFATAGFDYGRDFNLRDWVLFLSVVMPLWVGVEYLTGKPILPGVLLAACTYLHTFNVIHRHFHAPTGGFLERLGPYRFLHEHHRLHHARTNRNLNVVFPFADLVLGTFYRGSENR